MAVTSINVYPADGAARVSSGKLSVVTSSPSDTFIQTGRYFRFQILPGRTYYFAYSTHDSATPRDYALIATGTSSTSNAQYISTTYFRSDGVKTVCAYTCTDSTWKYLYVNFKKNTSFYGAWWAKSPTASDIDITDCVLDRSEADVYNLKQLKNKLTKYGLHSLYVRQGEAIENDWPYADEYADYLNGHKGAYNYTDLNRVGSIVSYLATYLGDCITGLAAYAASKGVVQTSEMKMPYVASDISVTPKTDWTYSDLPYADAMATYLGNITNLRGLVTLPSTTPAVPTNMNYMSIQKANAIEQILHDVYYAAQARYNDAIAAIDAYNVQVKTVGPLPVVSVADALTEDAISLNIQIVPVQSGSGDPSPSNIRPITGFTGANIYDDPVYGGTINWNQLRGDSATTQTSDGITTAYSTDSHLVTIKNNSRTSNYSSGSTQITLSSVAPIPGHKYALLSDAQYTGVYVSMASGSTLRSTNQVNTICTGAANATSFRLRVTKDYDFVTEHPIGDVLSFPINILDLTQMFGAGNEPSTIEDVKALFPLDYYAYNAGEATCVSAVNGNTYKSVSVDWQSGAGTVYGGNLDIVTGALTVNMAQIASYAGETLPGEWMSDRDVYAAGTTPTTGAQVVYTLATPQTYSLTPKTLALLSGNNNIWANTGDTTLTYFATL